MDTKKDRTDLAIETVETANQLNNEEQWFRLTATVIAIADKFLDDSYVMIESILNRILVFIQCISLTEDIVNIADGDKGLGIHLFHHIFEAEDLISADNAI